MRASLRAQLLLLPRKNYGSSKRHEYENGC